MIVSDQSFHWLYFCSFFHVLIDYYYCKWRSWRDDWDSDGWQWSQNRSNRDIEIIFDNGIRQFVVEADHLHNLMACSPLIYRKSLKETRGSYSFFEASNAGLIQGRVSFEGGSYLLKDQKVIGPPLVEVKPLLRYFLNLA